MHLIRTTAQVMATHENHQTGDHAEYLTPRLTLRRIKTANKSAEHEAKTGLFIMQSVFRNFGASLGQSNT